VRRLSVSFSLLVLSLGFESRIAWAARPARVSVVEAQLYGEPSPDSEVVEVLKQGRALAVSNEPVDEGFHKARTAQGVIGWVSPEQLVLFDIPPGGDTDQDLDSSSLSPMSERADSSTNSKKSVLIRAVGGGGIFGLSDLNSQLGLTGVRYGIHGGVEVSFVFGRWFGLSLRAEGLGKVFVVADEGANKSYQLSLYSYPVMAGLDLRLVDTAHFKMGLGGLFGMGFYSQMVSQSLNDSAPNETAFQSNAPAAVARLNVDVPIWHWLGLSFEAGYRYLKTQPMSPLVSGAGSEIFDDSEGESRPLTLDFSGPFASLGVVFLF